MRSPWKLVSVYSIEVTCSYYSFVVHAVRCEHVSGSAEYFSFLHLAQFMFDQQRMLVIEDVFSCDTVLFSQEWDVLG